VHAIGHHSRIRALVATGACPGLACHRRQARWQVVHAGLGGGSRGAAAERVWVSMRHPYRGDTGPLLTRTGSLAGKLRESCASSLAHKQHGGRRGRAGHVRVLPRQVRTAPVGRPQLQRCQAHVRRPTLDHSQTHHGICQPLVTTRRQREVAAGTGGALPVLASTHTKPDHVECVRTPCSRGVTSGAERCG
jgi:hypothetical protein